MVVSPYVRSHIDRIFPGNDSRIDSLGGEQLDGLGASLMARPIFEEWSAAILALPG
jgi:hypothetical protein